mmetsp:Transcript_22132/g.36924  ORF Transcript_22132/g.36924 Transcript_22132/m.36924 type:complete len:93 (-) Transcript_22132:301-579(-)|eukprot:CAMPEP_0198196936 /NCGR_PEP_ID=MMETSP1445-20131203/468_1 /TAXON_ID=36898 /ORGANISM="Pyramimonas sp., Strain CCMP2087" /LENGTH=92 /DNA_ID=CAMNT_0043866015 /DNA_START=152 /DNA_END=430 /DNA_ORIENTATION=-
MPKVKGATAKKKKDPNAPKRPLAAYMFFCKETRDKIKEELPESTFGEIGRILGQRWADADVPTKKRFAEMAEEDKVRYEADMKDYNATKKTE